MNPKSPDEIDRLLQGLQSKSFQHRKAAAEQLRQLDLRNEDHPGVDAGKLTEFKTATQQAVTAALDSTVLKQATSLPRLVPGFIPFLLCFAAQMLGFVPRGAIGALCWMVVMVFLGYWYAKCLLAGIAALTAQAGQVRALGREIGLLKTGPGP